ncbi:MAG: transporter substrate-binding domain-containing protein [Oligoflexia bacterium]|nr:transporter substrate-binding domain-containing protein [Oligoflexia bacterium]
MNNKKFFITLLFFLISPLFFISSYSAYSAETITIRSDNWMPYNGDPSDKNPGYIIELLKEIYKPYTITIDYQIVPFTRALKETREGKSNAVIGVYKEDAPDFIFPNEPLCFGQDGFFALKEQKTNWSFKDADSVANVKIGCASEYAYSDEKIIQAMKKYPASFDCIKGEDPLQTNIKKLLNKRIVAILENRSVMNWMIAKMNLQDKIIWATAVETINTPMFIAFSPKSSKSKDLAKKFDLGIKKLQENGVMKELQKKYQIQLK